jgi:hypothetical protein
LLIDLLRHHKYAFAVDIKRQHIAGAVAYSAPARRDLNLLVDLGPRLLREAVVLDDLEIAQAQADAGDCQHRHQ